MSMRAWEESEFPILCETCLGDNPYIRMTKQGHGKECKICTRPFTVFRWCPGAGMRYKKTEICQTCAKIKNVCQTCVLDLEYGLPVQVRDSVLNLEDAMPKSNVNLQFSVQNADATLGATETMVKYGKATSIAKETLKKLARVEPYYKRNRAHICSFYVKGECKRGDECPYRHEMPTDNELSHQNIKDRYHGNNDPVANKILAQAGRAIAKPDDVTVMSLFVTGVEFDITQDDLRTFFLSFGEIKSVVVVSKSRCAFINFASRDGAERAIDGTKGIIEVKGYSMNVQWGKSKSGASGPGQRSTAAPVAPVQPQVRDALTLMEGAIDPDMIPDIPEAPGAQKLVYASMDPNLLGTSAKNFRADD